MTCCFCHRQFDSSYQRELHENTHLVEDTGKTERSRIADELDKFAKRQPFYKQSTSSDWYVLLEIQSLVDKIRKGKFQETKGNFSSFEEKSALYEELKALRIFEEKRRLKQNKSKEQPWFNGDTSDLDWKALAWEAFEQNKSGALVWHQLQQKHWWLTLQDVEQLYNKFQLYKTVDINESL